MTASMLRIRIVGSVLAAIVFNVAPRAAGEAIFLRPMNVKQKVDENVTKTIDDLLQEFYDKHSFPGGISMAISYRERLVYSGAIGYADKEQKIPLSPKHRMRIASVSKPVTAIAIMKLVEDGKLCLSDEVFGKKGILGDELGIPKLGNGSVTTITVKHLLEHTAGGWGNSKNDPMRMANNRVINMSKKSFVQNVLETYPLERPPGMEYDYSNFGYCLLGRIIEKVTKMTYEDYVKKHILSPCGIKDMKIGGKTSDPGEVEYFSANVDPYVLSPLHMDAHGGWIANPVELLKLMVRADNFPGEKDLLNRATISVMTTSSAESGNYALGWRVNRKNTWFHFGAMRGTAAMIARTQNGFCWVILTNFNYGAGDMEKRSVFMNDMDRLFWRASSRIKEWPSGSKL